MYSHANRLHGDSWSARAERRHAAGGRSPSLRGLAVQMRGAPHADVLIDGDTITEVGPPGLARRKTRE